MTTLVEIEAHCEICGIEIERRPLPGDLKALYYRTPRTPPIVVLDPKQTKAEQKSRLAEELGHHYTTPRGHAVTPSQRTRKAEAAARRWAFRYVVSFTSIIEAWDSGARNIHEMAAALEVSEDFLIEALRHYNDAYGDHAICGDVMITFNPVSVIR